MHPEHVEGYRYRGSYIRYRYSDSGANEMKNTGTPPAAVEFTTLVLWILQSFVWGVNVGLAVYHFLLR